MQEPSDWVPTNSQTFKSFKEFEEKLAANKIKSNTEWVTGNSRSTEQENVVLRAKNKPLIDPTFKFQYVTYTCKCRGKERTGKGIRVNQSTWKINCPARMDLKYDKKLDRLILYGVYLTHNHRVTPEVKAAFPESRHLNEEESESVKNLLKVKVKPIFVRMLLAGQTNKRLTARDIVNIRPKMKKEKLGGLTEEDKLILK